MSHLWTMAKPNGKGTGCAITLELYPAHGFQDGYIRLCMARQKAVPTDVYTDLFDWNGAFTTCLGMDDLSHFMMVLRGYRESIEDGKGLFHRTAKMNAILRLEHRVEPVNGYLLEAKRRLAEHPNADMETWHILLREREALLLSLVLEHSLAWLAFGNPKEYAV